MTLINIQANVFQMLLWFTFPSFLPLVQSSCWLWIFLLCLESQLSSVYCRWLLLSFSFIRFTVSHFPKVPGTHFSVTLFLCFRKSIISGDSRNIVQKARRWHPLSPDLYSYLVLIAFFFIFHFSSTLQLPSSLTGRCILFLIKLLSYGISILQKCKALLASGGSVLRIELLAFM